MIVLPWGSRVFLESASARISDCWPCPGQEEVKGLMSSWIQQFYTAYYLSSVRHDSYQKMNKCPSKIKRITWGRYLDDTEYKISNGMICWFLCRVPAKEKSHLALCDSNLVHHCQGKGLLVVSPPHICPQLPAVDEDSVQPVCLESLEEKKLCQTLAPSTATPSGLLV